MTKWTDWFRLILRSPTQTDIFCALETSTEERALSVADMMMAIDEKNFRHVSISGMYVRLAELERSGAVLSRFVAGPYPRKRLYWLNRDSLLANIPQYVKDAVRGAQVSPDEIG